MLCYLYFVINLLALSSWCNKCLATSITELRAITNAIEAEDKNDFLNNRKSCQEAVTNFILGAATASLTTLSLDRNFFKVYHPEESKGPSGQNWSYAMRGLSYDYTDGWGIHHTLDMKDTVDSDDRNDVMEGGIGDFLLSFTSLYYLLRQDPLRDFFIGMMLGRIYFTRNIQNEFEFPQNYSIQLNPKAEPVNRFSRSRTGKNKFFSTRTDLKILPPTLPHKTISSGGNIAVIAAKERAGLCYVANEHGQCKQIFDLDTNDCSLKPVITAADLLSNTAKNFTTGVLRNYKLQTSNLDVIRQGHSFGHFTHLAKTVTGLGSGSEFYILDSPLITENYFLEGDENITIPVVSAEPNQAFIITPSANVVVIDDKGVVSKDTGIGHLRGACLDLAATKNFVAVLGVGRKTPQLASNRKLRPFDPLSGDNYFGYLRLVANSNIQAENQYITAENGQEGDDAGTCDINILFTDLDLKGEISLQSNSMSFLDFDKNGNLFILTDTGKILYYQSNRLANRAQGKLAPSLLRVANLTITTSNKSEDIEVFDYMSCGDGIIVRGKSDGTLYYLASEDIEKIMKGSPVEISWRPCYGNLKAANFAHLNDGSLLIYAGGDDDNLYFVEKSSYRTSFADAINIINNNKKLSNDDKNLQIIALFCHTVLDDKNRQYFGVSLPKQLYPTTQTTSDALNFIDTFTKIFPLLPKKIWNLKPGIVETVEQALDKLRVTFSSSEPVVSALKKFESDLLSKNIYFKGQSLRRTLQDLETASPTAEDMEAFAQKITDLVENTPYLLEKTGFNDLDEILVAEVDGNAATGKIGATILLEWLHIHKDELTEAFPVDYNKWITILNKLEKNTYVGTNVTTTTEIDLAKIKDAMDLLTELLDQEELTSRNKSRFLKALQDLVDNINFLAEDQVQPLKEGVLFLKNKFNMDSDPTIKKSFETLLSKIQVNYDVLYLVDKFKVGLVDLATIRDLRATTSADQTMITTPTKPVSPTTIPTSPAPKTESATPAYNSSISTKRSSFEPDLTTSTNELVIHQLELLKTIVESRADFEVLPNGIAIKNATISFLQNEITTNDLFKAYDENSNTAITGSFAMQLRLLEEAATLNNYIYSFAEFAKRSTLLGGKKEVIESLYNKMQQEPLVNTCSQENINTINAYVENLNKNGISLSKIDFRRVDTTFQTFLKNRKNEALYNLNKESHFWDVEDSEGNKSLYQMSVFTFWSILKRYQDFNPNLTSDKHKYKLLSLLNFLQLSVQKAMGNQAIDEYKSQRLKTMNQEILEQTTRLSE